MRRWVDRVQQKAAMKTKLRRHERDNKKRGGERTGYEGIG